MEEQREEKQNHSIHEGGVYGGEQNHTHLLDAPRTQQRATLTACV